MKGSLNSFRIVNFVGLYARNIKPKFHKTLSIIKRDMRFTKVTFFLLGLFTIN